MSTRVPRVELVVRNGRALDPVHSTVKTFTWCSQLGRNLQLSEGPHFLAYAPTFPIVPESRRNRADYCLVSSGEVSNP